ncbi:MAG TPA: FAD-dependent oxidoreductase [Spongiibacteraceae bacterium]|nr:FAD-dependent oxidoreductase [Spongiibacteraceae bacterium]
MSETFDFVIVGSGGGSMCAALVMRKAGKSVLILEKADLVGGTTATSGGVMWIPNNRFMKSEGVADCREQALAYLDAIAGDNPELRGATRERRATYVDEAPKMLDFLVEQGIKLRRIPSWPDYYKVPGESVAGRTVVSELFDLNQLGEWKKKLRPGFLPLPINLDEAFQMPLMKRSASAKKVLFKVIGRVLLGILTGKKKTTAGQALQGQMLLAATKTGVEIRTNAKVKQLVVENDRVAGVIVDNNGNDVRVDAELGVLINAGGFARNQRMLDQYIPGIKAEWSSVIAEDLGEMIEEGQRVGGTIAQMDARIGGQVAMLPGSPSKPAVMQNDTSKPHSMVVDQTGVRYMNEAGSSIEFARRMQAHNKNAPTIPSWMIFDSQYINTYMLAGSMPGPKKPQAWLEQNFLRKGETLDELAQACGIDATNLKTSVERFNDFARKGRDEDFQRGETNYEQWLGDPLREGNKSLGPIEQGPFYALQLFPGDVSTYGGLVTDVHARVLRSDGSAIQGLYATGTSTASALGTVEPGAGGSIGPAFTFGYIAAQHALSNSGA